MDFWTRMVLRLIIYTYLTLIAAMTVPHMKMLVGKYYYFTDSHISVIDTTTYGNENIRLVLDKFAEVCELNIVKYKHEGGLERTIEIYEVDEFMFSPSTLGRAWVERKKCTIELLKYMDYVQFRTTLIHEYLHCMGYEHVNQSTGDLMSPYDGEITEENIEGYAKDLCEVLKWSKNLKN